MVQKIIQFIRDDIWRFRAGKSKGWQGFGLRAFRILLVSLREFSTDKCALRASALTFFSLLSIVPVFAMAFGLAKGFGLDRHLREKLLENMEGQQEVFTRIMDFSENLLANTKGGIIAGIGLLFLFWTVIRVLANIESSFNDIWGVKKQRSMSRKFSDYLSLMLIGPVFFVTASSLTVFIVSQIQGITQSVAFLGYFAPVILTLLRIIPFAVFWALLTYLYIFMPNTKINFSSALLGGVVAGTVYQIVQWGYIHFQIGVGKAGAIYGSFAALPLFLMWLQISWLIVLYGAELAFAHQNEQTFEFEPDCLKANARIRKLLALRMTQLCVRRFADGLPPLSTEEIAAHLETPVRLTRDLLFQLSEAGVLIQVQGQSERERRFHPATDIHDLTIQTVLEKMEKAGSSNVPVAESAELEALKESLQAFENALRDLPENKLLKEISPLLSPVRA